MVITNIQCSLIKKLMIRRPEHSLTPSPPPRTSHNISFLLYSPRPSLSPPLKVEVICVSSLILSPIFLPTFLAKDKKPWPFNKYSISKLN